jgi:hypothetical protein
VIIDMVGDEIRVMNREEPDNHGVNGLDYTSPVLPDIGCTNGEEEKRWREWKSPACAVVGFDCVR